jgi:hypothetical protein
VLWILTLGDFAIYYFPADAFYFAKSLPITYWAGVILSITTILVSLFSGKSSNNIKIIPQIILALYLHGLAPLTYERYRYGDTYFHETGVLRILKDNVLPSSGYSAEYPHAFILMDQFIEITDITPLIILKSYEIFTMVLLTLLVYLLAKQISSKYAPIASFAFVSLFWIDQGHFSPQAVALPFYLILWLAMIRIFGDQRTSRANIVLLVLALIAINIASPTNSVFILLSFVGVILVLLIKGSRHIIKRQYNGATLKKISYMLLLHLVIWLTWSNYMAESRGLTRPLEKMTSAIQSITSSFVGTDIERTALPPSPEYSYLVVNIVEYSTGIILLVSGLAAVILLYTRHKIKPDTKLPLLAGWFVGSLFVGPFALFFGPTMVERVYMYAIFPWAALVILIMSRSLSQKKILLPSLFVIFIIVSALLIPLSKYGQDAVFYNPTSSLYLSEFLTTNAEQGFHATLLSPMRTQLHYFSVIHGSQTSISEPYDYGTRRANVTDYDSLLQPFEDGFDYTLVSEGRNNNQILRLDSDYISIVEDYVQDRHNLIMNNGDARAYVYRFK